MTDRELLQSTLRRLSRRLRLVRAVTAGSRFLVVGLALALAPLVVKGLLPATAPWAAAGLVAGMTAAGLFYGFLLALIAYNAMLWVGLRERGYFDYVLNLGSFFLLHLAYTGHGYAWLWPQYAGLQQYAIPLLMLAFGCSGLRFASGFLELRQHAPITHRTIHVLMALAAATILLASVSGRQQHAVLVAFLFVLAFSLAMVWIGVMTVQHSRDAGGYFLAAAVAVGISATSTFAGEPLHSPRGLANQIKRVPGTNNDVNLVSGWYPGAAVKQGAMFHSAVESRGIKDANLATRDNLPLYTGKNPARDLHAREFQVAPLK